MKCSAIRMGALAALLLCSSGTSSGAAEWGSLEGLIVAPHPLAKAPSLLSPDLQRTMMSMFPQADEGWTERVSGSDRSIEQNVAAEPSPASPQAPLRRPVGHGIAAWYKHHGRTASGEMFNAASMTAAHKTLPFGTRLHVVNAQNGRSATVRINDRISRKAKARLDPAIELSQAGARALGIEGVARVSMYVTDEQRGR